jgi:drug/metabolite transporter (DMT)-like permease
MPTRRVALLVAAGSNLLWAGSYVAGKAALDEIPFVTLNVLRFALAGAIYAPLVWRGRAALPRDRLGLAMLVGIAGLGFVCNKGLEFAGLSLTTATDTALLITTESAVTLLLAVLVLGERLRPLTAAALGLAAAGVYVLVEGGRVAPRLPAGAQAGGDLLVVASLVLESGATICSAALLRRGHALVVTGAAVLLSLAVWTPAAGAVAVRDGLPHLSAGAWAGVAYLAIVTTCVAYGGWLWSLQWVSAQDVTPLLLLQPLAGTVIAAVVRGERPTAATFAGGGLVLAGVLLVGAGGRHTRNDEREPIPMVELETP